MNPMPGWFEQLEQDGFALLPDVFTSAEIESACESCERSLADVDAASSLLVDDAGQPYGARNLLRLWPHAIRLARAPQLALPLLRVLGPNGGMVRGLYFDKPPGSSWALPWHRDLTIAVKDHGPMGRFKKLDTGVWLRRRRLLPDLSFRSEDLLVASSLDDKGGPA